MNSLSHNKNKWFTTFPVEDSMNQHLEYWVASLKRLSPKTVKDYTYNMRQFYSFVQENNFSMIKVDAVFLDNYLDMLRTKGDPCGKAEPLSTSSINIRLAAIKSYFTFLVNMKYITHSPIASVKSYKVERGPKTAKTYFTIEEVRAMLDTCNMKTLAGNRDWLLIYLLAQTGLRREEAQGILWGDFGQENGYTVIYIKRKGSKEKSGTIPVTNKLMGVLNRYKEFMEKFGASTEPTSPLLLSVSKRNMFGRLSLRSISEIVQTRKELAGILDPNNKKTAHSLRHTKGTMVMRRLGADAASQALGHTSTKYVLQTYAKDEADRKRYETEFDVLP